MNPNQDYWAIDVFDPEPESDWADVDARWQLPNDDQLVKLARMIDHVHKGQRDDSAIWRMDDYRLVGLCGERAFARVFGCRMNTTVSRYGGKRKNARLQSGDAVDVVTRRVTRGGDLPDLTMREAAPGGNAATILVLIVWNGFGAEPVLAGWIERRVIAEQGERRQFKEGVINRVMPIAMLRPMHELMERHRKRSPLRLPESAIPPVRLKPPPPAPDPEPQLALL